jgi:hypothetical protein
VFLKEHYGTLFGVEYDLLLYDVTSTYFEGQANANLCGLGVDTYRTRVFKEENWLLGSGKGPFGKEQSLVYATPLSDPAVRLRFMAFLVARYGGGAGQKTIPTGLSSTAKE